VKLKQLVKNLNNLTILIVEDNPSTANDMVELLSNFTTYIQIAYNGQEALNILATKKVNLIITDISMPIMDGTQFVSILRQKNKKIPIIVLTSYATNEYLLTFANLNIQAYILKPIQFDKLTNALYKVLDYMELDSTSFITVTNELYYDTNNAILHFNDKTTVQLNNKEKQLFDLLIQDKNNIVDYKTIEQKIWQNNDESMSSTALRTVVKNLRKKIKFDIIKNVSGSGYKLIA